MVKTQKKINDIQQLINEKVAASLEVSNHEMGVIKDDMSRVKEDIAEIKTHITWIKEVYGDWEKRWDKLDNRIWVVMGTIVTGTLLSIAINLYFK